MIANSARYFFLFFGFRRDIFATPSTFKFVFKLVFLTSVSRGKNVRGSTLQEAPESTSIFTNSFAISMWEKILFLNFDISTALAVWSKDADKISSSED